MKKILCLTVLFSIFMDLGNLSYGGAAPNPTGGCKYVYGTILGGDSPSQGGIPKNQGTNVLGQFIATQEINSNNVVIQVMISKGNTWYSYDFTADSGGISLCASDMTDERLLDSFYLWPCEFGIQDEVMGSPPLGYDGYISFATSLFTKGYDCNNPGQEFLPENGAALPGYVAGAYSKAKRWGDVKLKFVTYKLSP
jgi:hypothetical protein